MRYSEHSETIKRAICQFIKQTIFCIIIQSQRLLDVCITIGILAETSVAASSGLAVQIAIGIRTSGLSDFTDFTDFQLNPSYNKQCISSPFLPGLPNSNCRWQL